MIDFRNKKVLITGATGGIGQALVKKFVSLNANVLATGTNNEKLDLLSGINSVVAGSSDDEKAEVVKKQNHYNQFSLTKPF